MRKLAQYVLSIVLPIVLLIGVSAVGAQSVMPITDAASVAAAKDDQSVTLRGQIVKQETRNQYLFSDGTGNVLVEIKDDLIKGNHLPVGTEVEIEGRVETRFLKAPKVEARSVIVLASSGLPKYQEPGRDTPEERG
jgi:uncharacterized protein (TIGR00156 family)